jgi:hypothetical protein
VTSADRVHDPVPVGADEAASDYISSEHLSASRWVALVQFCRDGSGWDSWQDVSVRPEDSRSGFTVEVVTREVLEADPEVTETIKRIDRPYFVLEGNVCALLAAKDHVNVFLYDPLVPDPEGIITSGHENKSGRTVAIRRGEAIDEEALVAMFRAIIAHNRAGGWRKIMREQ